MHLSPLFSLITLASASTYVVCPPDPSRFLLVTTSQLAASTDPSQLKAVSATSLFDPFHQPALLLRLIGPGYDSLPVFMLVNGTLSTISQAPFNNAQYRYNNTVVEAGRELQFVASEQPAGNMALYQGYLLTVNDERVGWTICKGVLSTEVLTWKGTASSCRKTYVHAVMKAPY